MNISRSEIHALRSERRAYAQAVAEIRDVTGLHSVPLDQLAGAVEDIISNLAVQNSILAGDMTDPGPTVDETAQVVAEAYDDWAPEDTVVPSCCGCLRLVEIDGRLMCAEARSTHHTATLTWPGPGCVWGNAGDAVYGGGRG